MDGYLCTPSNFQGRSSNSKLAVKDLRFSARSNANLQGPIPATSNTSIASAPAKRASRYVSNPRFSPLSISVGDYIGTYDRKPRGALPPDPYFYTPRNHMKAVSYSGGHINSRFLPFDRRHSYIDAYSTDSSTDEDILEVMLEEPYSDPYLYRLVSKIGTVVTNTHLCGWGSIPGKSCSFITGFITVLHVFSSACRMLDAS